VGPRHHTPASPFVRLSEYLQQRYGQRVYKVCINSGLGCPNRDGTAGIGGCSFCSASALEPVGFHPALTTKQQLEDGIAYVRQRHGAQRFIAYYQDDSSTYAEVSRLAALYQPALALNEVVALAVSTRPDCLAEPVIDLLQQVKCSKDLWVELGLQIADDRLLEQNNRGHTVGDFERAVARCHARGFDVCAHVIIGLPGATAESERRTAQLLADLNLWGVKLHAFHLLRNTQLAARHARQPLSLLSRDAYITRAVDFLERLPPQLVVHRVTGSAPRRLTIAPEWTINNMAVFDAVLAEFERRGTQQGCRWVKAAHSDEVGA